MIPYIIPIYISYIFNNKAAIYLVYFTFPIASRLILEIFYKWDKSIRFFIYFLNIYKIIKFTKFKFKFNKYIIL